jgi:hypothetical protein
VRPFGRSARARFGIRMMIGRSLTPLNCSKTTRDVARCDENSRQTIQNVDGASSAKNR